MMSERFNVAALNRDLDEFGSIDENLIMMIMGNPMTSFGDMLMQGLEIWDGGGAPGQDKGDD